MAEQNPTAEQWLPVVGFEGLYEVSDLGRIRSLRTGKIRIPGTVTGGYRQIALCVSGKKSFLLVSRIVLSSFDRPPRPREEADHRDFDRGNNRLKNLQWKSKQANMDHSTRAGRRAQKLTADSVRQIRRRYAAGEKQADLALEFGVTQGSISMTVSGQKWKHV
jgi:hypothetical protein